MNFPLTLSERPLHDECEAVGILLPAIIASYSFTVRRAALMPSEVVETGPSESVLAKKTRSIG